MNGKKLAIGILSIVMIILGALWFAKWNKKVEKGRKAGNIFFGIVMVASGICLLSLLIASMSDDGFTAQQKLLRTNESLSRQNQLLTEAQQ